MSSVELLERCVCGIRGGESDNINGIAVKKCTACGVVRQVVPLTGEALALWYRDHYHDGCYRHSYAHDVAVANKRLDKYRIASEAKLLDVGAGNGAFVAAARDRGIDAFGQDLAQSSNSDVIYVGDLINVAFPTDGFDVVTMHDVLEHMVDPEAMLREVRRILRRPGKLIIDFPRFWREIGTHHWKEIEHLWMFTEDQLVKLVQRCGFNVTWTYNPIPSKFTIEAEPLPENRPQILVPAGIGDALWVMTKLPGLLRKNWIRATPDVWVQDAGGPKRTQPYLKNLPLVNAAGYKKLGDRDPIFHEAYMQDGRTIFTDVLGVDYFIAYNGVLRAGRSLEEVDPQYGCDWYPKMHVSKAALKMKERMQGPGMPYILTYWAEAGMYRQWLAEFSVDEIYSSLRILQQELGVRIVFMGSPWDRGQVGRKIADMDDGFENLIGATSFDQMLGCIMGASAVVGFPAGNTILAATLGIPTVLLWNDYFVPNFWKYACPQTPNYVALNTATCRPSQILGEVRKRMEIAGA